MTDRELLELAAKAAGIQIRKWDSDYDTYMMGHPDNGKEGFLIEYGIGSSIWNPLTDDGDALRLAVKLCMNVEVTDSYVFACSVGNFSEPAKPDRNSAVRRAIVRAAAAMASNGETV